MRRTSTLTVIIALGFGAMAFAQQEQTASTPAEEQSSTTVQETATTTPAVETKPSKPTAAATVSPSGKSAKMASPAAATHGKKMSVEATLKDNENRWEASFASHNASVSEPMMANDFVEVYWDGKMMNKSEALSQIKKDKDTYKSAVNEKLAVHIFGKNVAVVVGTAHEKGTTKDGKMFDRQYRFTDTWVERNGQWQCVASQVMKIKG